MTDHRETVSLTGLVSVIRQLDIDIPLEVEQEVMLHKDLQRTQKQAQEALDAAKSALRTVAADKFDAAATEVVDASLRLFAVSSGADALIAEAVARRLQGRVYDAVSGWEAEIVDRFNEVVEDYRLNEVAADLPRFGDTGSYNVLSLGAAQGQAVEQWRTAASALHPLWSGFTRLAKLNGRDIGPTNGADSVADGLFTGCCLGDPVTFGGAESAATLLAKIAEGVDSVRATAPLQPFLVPHLAGYDLRLHTVSQATVIRTRIQLAA
jgi:hypothetical protein